MTRLYKYQIVGISYKDHTTVVFDLNRSVDKETIKTMAYEDLLKMVEVSLKLIYRSNIVLIRELGIKGDLLTVKLKKQ